MAAALPLSYAVPASLGLFSYLNAKYSLAHDIGHMASFIGVQISGIFKERRDGLNLFYTLEEWAQKSPNHVFIIYNGRKTTYKEAYEKVLRYGTWLKSRFGVKKNEVVAMDLMNSDVFIWVWLGIWAIGAKPAFINYNLNEKPLLHCVKSSTARVLLMEEEIYNSLDETAKSGLQAPDFREDGSRLEYVVLDSATISEIDNTIGKREPHEARSGQLLKDMAILIFTSGTTGLPKPAIVSWSKTSVSPHIVYRWLGLSQDDIFYTSMPLYHSSAALLGLCAILAAGASLSIGRKFHRRGFWEDVRASNATIIQYVGETCRYLMSSPPSPEDKQHNVRLAFGNGLRPDVWPLFKERFNIPVIAEFYGATEAPSAFFNISKNKFREGAVGHNGLIASTLLGSTSLVVEMDYEENRPVRDPKTGFCIPVKPGMPGELLFKLDAADIEKQFQGYYKNKGATSKKILRDVLVKGDVYFSTGDVLRRDSEGRWYFCDRIGDTYRWKSENVATAEVAEVLGQKHELLAEANVYGVAVPGHDGRAGCVAVLLSPDQQSKLQSTGNVPDQVLSEVATHAQKRLPKYAIPIFFRVMKDESASHRTGTNKQQKHIFRDEGIDPSKVEANGDLMFWLAPGEKAYRRFGEQEFKMLNAGQVKL